jgi:hypothetical protein
VIREAAKQGLKIVEIPAVLEWRHYGEGEKSRRRPSSLKIPEQIKSHMTYLLRVNPKKCLWRTIQTALFLGIIVAITAWALARWIF